MKWILGQLQQFRLTRGKRDAISTVFALPDICISLKVKTRYAQIHRECCGVHHHNPHLARPKAVLLWWQIRGQQRKNFPVSSLHWNINFMRVGTESIHCIELGTRVTREYLWKGKRKKEGAIHITKKVPNGRQHDLLLGMLPREVKHSVGTRYLEGLYEPWDFYLNLQGWGQSGEQSGDKTVPLFIYVQRAMICC